MISRGLTPFRIYALLLVLIVGFALLPLIGVMTASMIANTAGCRVDEGGSYPCVVAGTDIGDMLATLFTLGWFMLLTLPIGALLCVVWAAAIVVHLVRKNRRPV